MDKNNQMSGKNMNNKQDNNSGNMQKYLKGINFPASKQDLIQAAKNNDAPNSVIQQIRGMNKQQFSSSSELKQAMTA